MRRRNHQNADALDVDDVPTATNDFGEITFKLDRTIPAGLGASGRRQIAPASGSTSVRLGGKIACDCMASLIDRVGERRAPPSELHANLVNQAQNLSEPSAAQPFREHTFRGAEQLICLRVHPRLSCLADLRVPMAHLEPGRVAHAEPPRGGQAKPPGGR